MKRPRAATSRLRRSVLILGCLLRTIAVAVPAVAGRHAASPQPATARTAGPVQPTALVVTVPVAPGYVRGSGGRAHIDHDLLVANWVAGTVTHRITYDLPSNRDPHIRPFIGSRQVDGPRLRLDRHRPAVIAAPLHGPGRINAVGCCQPWALHARCCLAPMAAGSRARRPRSAGCSCATAAPALRAGRRLRSDHHQQPTHGIRPVPVRGRAGPHYRANQRHATPHATDLSLRGQTHTRPHIVWVACPSRDDRSVLATLHDARPGCR
jgi:hypothetical protein